MFAQLHHEEFCMFIRSTIFLAALLAATPLAAQDISPERLAETVQVLASDSFEGRAPGTRGEDRTIGYLIGRFHTNFACA